MGIGTDADRIGIGQRIDQFIAGQCARHLDDIGKALALQMLGRARMDLFKQDDFAHGMPASAKFMKTHFMAESP
jgi:hypothetical protein